MTGVSSLVACKPMYSLTLNPPRIRPGDDGFEMVRIARGGYTKGVVFGVGADTHWRAYYAIVRAICRVDEQCLHPCSKRYLRPIVFWSC